MGNLKRRALAAVVAACVLLSVLPSVALAADPVTLEYLGHSAFILQNGVDKLVIDPGVWATPYDLSADGIDVAVMTHQHSDHFYPPAVASVASKVCGVSQVGDFVSVTDAVYGQFKLTDVSTLHGTTDLNAAFIIETAGMRIVHLGDAFGSMGSDGLASNAAQLKGVSGIDVLMVPVGNANYGQLAYTTVRNVIANLAPKVVIPIHAWDYHQAFIDAAAADHLTVVQKSPVETFSTSTLPTSGTPVIWDMAESMAPAAISGVEPSAVLAGANTPIAISGTGFRANATVRLVNSTTSVVAQTFSVTDAVYNRINVTVPSSLPAGTYNVETIFPPQAPYRDAAAQRGSALSVYANMPPTWTGLSVTGSTLTLTFSENVKTLDPSTGTEMTADDLVIKVDGSSTALTADKITAISTANLDKNQITVDLAVTPVSAVYVELLGGNHVIDADGQTMIGSNVRTWSPAPPSDTTPPTVTVTSTGAALTMTTAERDGSDASLKQVVAISNESGTLYLVKDSVTVSGTNAAKVTAMENAVVAKTALKKTATAGGSITFDIPDDLVDGTYNFYAVDGALNVSAASAESVVIQAKTPTVGQVPTVVGTVYADGSVAAGLTPFFQWDSNTKLAQLQVQKSGSLNISGAPDNYTANTVFTLKVNNGDFSPFLVLGAGEIQSWTVSGGVTTITVKGVHFKPNDTTDFPLSVALAIQYDPDPSLVPAEYYGMHISTNGNQFVTPYKDPSGRLAMQVGGASGVSDGFFQAYLPQDLLTAWGVTNTAQLKAFIGDADGSNQQAVSSPTVTSVTGGYLIRFAMSFSTHKVFIGEGAAPTVISSNPSDAATGVGRNVTIRVTFSEAIAEGDNYNSITLKDASGNSVAFSKSRVGLELTVDPMSDLAYNTTYTLTLPAGAVKDTAGNGLAAQVTRTFTTLAAPSQPPADEEEPVTPPVVTPPPDVKVNDGQADLSDLVEVKTSTTSDGTTVARAEVDQTDIDSALAKKDVKQVVVDINKSGDEHVAGLPASALGKMAEKAVDLVVKTGKVALSIPPQVVDVAKVAKELGVAEADVKVEVKVKEVPQAAADALTGKASEVDSALQPVGTVFELSLEATAGGRKVSIDAFGRDVVSGEIPLTGSDLSKVKDIRKVNVFKYDEAGGKWVPVPTKVDPATNKVTFFTRTFSNYTIMELDKTFADIATHWAKEDVELMASKMIVKGETPTEFKPEQNVTRTEFAAMLVRALGLGEKSGGMSQFSDVASTDWFYGIVEAAKQANIATGSEGRFSPNDQISRQEMAAMAVRALRYTGKVVSMSDVEQAALIAGFRDGASVASWATHEMAQAVKTGVVKGTDGGNLAPTSLATRAEAATMVKRVLEQVGW